jgi:hypothetical protein
MVLEINVEVVVVGFMVPLMLWISDGHHGIPIPTWIENLKLWREKSHLPITYPHSPHIQVQNQISREPGTINMLNTNMPFPVAHVAKGGQIQPTVEAIRTRGRVIALKLLIYSSLANWL